MAASLISTIDSIATNNTKPTTVNSNISGDANNAAPSIFASTDITAPHSGLTTLKYTLSGVAANALEYWDVAKWSTAPSGLTYWIRYYLYITVLPNNTSALSGETTTAFSTKQSVRLTTAGKLTVFNGSGTLAGTSTSTIPLNQWVRIEAQIFHDATVGQTVLRYYSSAESTTITETLTGSTGTTLGSSGTTAVERVFVGNNGGSQTLSNWYYADVVFSDTGWIGPVLQQITDNDSVTATEGVGNRTLTQGETGTFTEVGVPLVPKSAADTGTATDIGVVVVPVSAGETVTVVDSGIGLPGPVGFFFTPPTVQQHFQFHNRVTRYQNTGITILKTAGTYTAVQDPTAELVGASDIAYIGGRDYLLTSSERAALIVAGYGSYISTKTIVG